MVPSMSSTTALAPLQTGPVVVHPADLLHRVLEPRRHQDGAQIDLNAASATRAARLADRTAAKVATARTRVPMAVANDGDGRPVRRQTIDAGHDARARVLTPVRRPIASAGRLADSAACSITSPSSAPTSTERRLLRRRPRLPRRRPGHGVRWRHRLRHPADADVLDWPPADRRRASARRTSPSPRPTGRRSGRSSSRRRNAGAEMLHEPRLWPEYHPNYYGAFVRDPDGNNVEAVCHTPE